MLSRRCLGRLLDIRQTGHHQASRDDRRQATASPAEASRDKPTLRHVHARLKRATGFRHDHYTDTIFLLCEPWLWSPV